MTENIKIRSINVGKPAQVIHNGKEVSTGINKTPVNGAIYLSLLNFEGMDKRIMSIMAEKTKRYVYIPLNGTLIGNRK